MTADAAQTGLVESMGQQLSELYADQETLTKAFGPISAQQIVTMVSSLEAQVVSFYENALPHSPSTQKAASA